MSRYAEETQLEKYILEKKISKKEKIIKLLKQIHAILDSMETN